MESYFGAFSLKQYMDATVPEAKVRGATRTQFRRCRTCTRRTTACARRRNESMNAGSQGLAADIFRLALVRLDCDLEEQKLASRLVLQVHDEVIVEMPPGEGEVRRLTESALTGMADLKVPLTVSMATGRAGARLRADGQLSNAQSGPGRHGNPMGDSRPERRAIVTGG